MIAAINEHMSTNVSGHCRVHLQLRIRVMHVDDVVADAKTPHLGAVGPLTTIKPYSCDRHTALTYPFYVTVKQESTFYAMEYLQIFQLTNFLCNTREPHFRQMKRLQTAAAHDLIHATRMNAVGYIEMLQ